MSIVYNPLSGEFDEIGEKSINDGTAQGQLAFWDATLSKWVNTETSELVWNDTSKILTFGNFPITPSSAPTTNYQVANKKYVDDNGGASYDTDDIITAELELNNIVQDGRYVGNDISLVVVDNDGNVVSN